MDFGTVKRAVALQFQGMVGRELFRTAVGRDAMWETYLASFPPGSDPTYRVRTEHDCSCCRQFVGAVGNVVAVGDDGQLVSIWDADCGDSPYASVVAAMAALVKSHPIADPFLHFEGRAGVDRNFEEIRGSSGAVVAAKTWEHFSVGVPNSRVCERALIPTRLAEARAHHDVLLRSLSELTVDAVDAVLDLIARGALYRGEENLAAVTEFARLKAEFDLTPPDLRDNLAWRKLGEVSGAVSKIRNTAIGTLLVDLSEGRDLEAAVGAFESVVAPANYKRPTALVTKAMVEKARETVASLGLTSALERRHATQTDVTADRALFVDRSAGTRHQGDVFDDLPTRVGRRSFDRAEEVGVDRFVAEVVPTARSIEVLMENRLVGNLVSLVAPVDPESRPLFKWGNRFSWSYNGDFADSIRERVKRAGGNVTGELCCRLAWHNHDDLDLHLTEPGGNEIHFANRGPSRLGGQLDVDMNVGPTGLTREPVENVFYVTADRMREGDYHLFVHQFTSRESANVGFEVEVDFRGDVRSFAYDRPVKRNQEVNVATLRYSRTGGLEVVDALPSTAASRKVWGIDTQAFHRVTVVLPSPNHWDAPGVGNRHLFFVLDGCRNDGTARGFYNEFLRSDLDPHRKVLEMVGSRMRTEEATDQLSGLGFSSTQRNHAVVRVTTGESTRVVRVAF